MKKFLEKHILFPKKQGIGPYFYLFFLLPIIAGLAQNVLWQQVLGLLLILVFLKAYRDAFWPEHYALKIGIQLAIVLILAVSPWFSTFGLQIFTGFEIGFTTMTNRRWRGYLLAYYLVAVASFTLPLAFSPFSFAAGDLVWVLVGILFIFFSPIFAKAMSRTYDLTQQNRQLTARVQKLERERIAYDLHDNLGQTFSTISLQAELAGKLMDKNPAAAKAELDKIQTNAHGSLTLVREIVADLKADSMAQILADAEKALRMAQIELSVSGEFEDFPTPLAAVLKEALTNVVRHSQAQKVSVKFDRKDKAYNLTIVDDGKGLTDAVMSHGMMGMQRRVASLGGTFSVKSDRGTSLIIQVPKKEVTEK